MRILVVESGNLYFIVLINQALLNMAVRSVVVG